MSDWTKEQLLAERGNILDQMERLTEGSTSEGDLIRSSGEKKIAQLEKQLVLINRQIARLSGSVKVASDGQDQG